MSKKVQVRAFLNVTITVPLDMDIDLQELDEWMTEDGGPEWDGSSDDIAEFIRSGDPADWMAPFPKADPDIHGVETAELVEVDVLGAVGGP